MILRFKTHSQCSHEYGGEQIFCHRDQCLYYQVTNQISWRQLTSSYHWDSPRIYLQVAKLNFLQKELFVSKSKNNLMYWPLMTRSWCVLLIDNQCWSGFMWVLVVCETRNVCLSLSSFSQGILKDVWREYSMLFLRAFIVKQQLIYCCSLAKCVWDSNSHSGSHGDQKPVNVNVFLPSSQERCDHLDSGTYSYHSLFSFCSVHAGTFYI